MNTIQGAYLFLIFSYTELFICKYLNCYGGGTWDVRIHFQALFQDMVKKYRQGQNISKQV